MTWYGRGRTRGGRRWWSTVAAGVAVLAPAGCSPEERPLAGVAVDADGTVRALLRPCDDDGRVRGPRLHGTVPERAGDTEREADAAAERWVGWEARGTERAEKDFPLFAPPKRWQAETRGAQELRPGLSYRLTFGDPDDTYAYSGVVIFDAAQVAALRPGEVLTGTSTTSREEFEDEARASC
ncbi:hypothetical protein [Streptomyces yaizuensis]|uniref:Lipoprotein n=1 Tax=Streptomyces yaizuensis TaxID=2989713 RepID=A0ABQ5NRF7_9ACTN|nr:hypothetical protein [Streptomyces sp. YSPA8]GLF92925.1 lipoprotein [Streptomyces sp. YSPA8]